MKKSYMMD